MSKKGQSTECRPITDLEDIQKLLDVPGRDGLFFTISLYIGARVGEIATLRFRDFLDFGRVPKPKDRVQITCQKQTSMQGRLVTRHMRVPEIVQDKVVEFWESQHKPELDRFIFLAVRNRVPGQPMSITSFNSIVKKYFKTLGIKTKNHSSHTLRKTMARQFYERAKRSKQSIDALILTSKMLGHKNVEYTLRYIGLDEEDIDKSLEDFYYADYTPLTDKLKSGKININKMWAEVKAIHPYGPPSTWRSEMEARLSEYRAAEVKSALDLYMPILVKL